ncbi:COMM domain-containing protein 6 isoform X2 [Sparus aurata]|uniref:COMM domain-containing protein 6 isoform X2 n=1 Tax=Sparus aurata TaxID=8175 RepID=UPI0011C10002|nr:COMM domain-containing protein 6 isoform X2 [Sparus aurata]
MPAAEDCHGVNKVVDNISRFSPDLLADACQHILSYLQGQTRGVDSAEISDSVQRAGVRLDNEALQNVIRFLLLTFRSAGQSNSSADDLVSRLEEGSSKWPKASLQVLHRLWSEHGASVHAQQKLQATLSISQVVEPSGQICQKSFEMTVPQFQNFHKQFKEMAAVMETV